MNIKLLLPAIALVVLGSCTTLYKSGQTPDDVYYSPARTAGYVEDRKIQQRDEGNDYYSNAENRSIRLGINDMRYRYLDYDYNYSNSLYINDYSYSPYSYGFNYGYYYNPYYWPYPVYGYGSVFVNPYTVKNTTPRMANLGSYNLPGSRSTENFNHGGFGQVRTYNNSNRGSAFGNTIRQIFTPSNNSNSNSVNNQSNNNRTYTPATSSSSSSSGRSSGGGGGGSVSRPPR